MYLLNFYNGNVNQLHFIIYFQLIPLSFCIEVSHFMYFLGGVVDSSLM